MGVKFSGLCLLSLFSIRVCANVKKKLAVLDFQAGLVPSLTKGEARCIVVNQFLPLCVRKFRKSI